MGTRDHVGEDARACQWPGLPVCVEFSGDSPIEYWFEDDPSESDPFDLAEVNRWLSALGQMTA